jgi:hypothetical protein
MSRANVVLLMFLIAMTSGTTVVASDNPTTNINAPQAATDTSASQNQAGGVMNVPLLVVVDGRGQVRDIQHSQRLPTQLNDLLWKSVREWTKSSALIDGRHAEAQFLMNVTLHAEPRADGTENVYFTLASEGPVLRGYWRLRYNHLEGRCTTASDMDGGDGGKTYHCSSELVPASAASTPAPQS